MLAVKINRVNFEYDVNSIVKAFFPEEMVKVITPETGQDKREAWEADVKLQITFSEEGAIIESLLGQETIGQSPVREDMSVRADAVTAMKAEEWRWQYDKAAEEGDSYKNAFKRFLYQSLSRITGKELPWGALTGIRPTKLSYGMLEEGMNDDEIISFYQKKYFASEEKARLSIEIAKRERELLSGVHYEGGYSLYIGIPFCPTTCLYCSFTSFAIGAYRKRVDEYIDCLTREMQFVSEKYQHKILDSVYIGGGTPTTLEAEQLDRLLTHLHELFDFSTVQEFTVEAGRADSITREKLEVLRRHGVTRISINPQTMKQETLDIIGRRHTVEQVEQAFYMARDVGFDNINMDIILGLPGETAEDVQATMDRITELAPDSLTVHSLAIKRASRLSQWILENGVSTLNNTDQTMEIAAKGAAQLGLEPYYLYRQKNMSGNFENVGYARPGKYGLYNILIMEEVQTIIALGAGSISKLVLPDGRIERSENIKEVSLYIEKIEEMLDRKAHLFGLES